MKFFFPDSQDQIDPDFDFETEERSPFRVRQRDDRYAHEVLADVPYRWDAWCPRRSSTGSRRRRGEVFSAQQRHAPLSRRCSASSSD